MSFGLRLKGWIAFAALGVWGACASHGQEGDAGQAEGDVVGVGVGADRAELTGEANVAIERGLEALARLQHPDGAFGSGRYGKNVAITSVACLAFMADGNLPGRGRYGHVVEAGLEWLLDNQSDTGLFAAQTSHGPMYGHGFATLFVAEAYGMTAMDGRDPLSLRLHDATIRATQLILRSQNEEGGWRYNPVPFDADVSVTICQVMALRSVRNAGLEVPRETIDRAVEYVRACQNDDGGFSYMLSSRGASAWPRTAAGVATLFYAGEYEDAAVDGGIDYLMDNALPGSPGMSRAHLYYGHYYAAQAMFLAGGDAWATWWPALRGELIRTQLETGLWEDTSVSEEYGTAMALICLQMPKRYLPIFQK